MKKLLKPITDWLEEHPKVATTVAIVIVLFIVISSFLDLKSKVFPGPEQEPITQDTILVITGSVEQSEVEVGGDNEITTGSQGFPSDANKTISGNVKQKKVKVNGKNTINTGNTLVEKVDTIVEIRDTVGKKQIPIKHPL